MYIFNENLDACNRRTRTAMYKAMCAIDISRKQQELGGRVIKVTDIATGQATVL